MSVAESMKSHLGNLLGTGKTQAALRVSVTLLLLFLLARTGADLTWQLGATFLNKGRVADPSQLQSQVTPLPQTLKNRPTPPAEEIALFGQATETSSPPGGLAEAAPVSTLNLVLKGIVAVRPMRRALAVIAERGGAAEKLYSQGEEISANVVIREIHPDRVIISRGATRETLFLEGFQDQSPKPGGAPMATNARAAANDYIQPKGDGINWLINQDYWAERLADVPGLAREVGVEVYSENSQQKGYRLVAVQNSKLLNTLGLQPGDILLSVNGRAMNNIQEGLNAYQQVKNGGQVTIEINRNGHRESRVYNISG
jgi:general secretion pathway protein C